MKDCRGLFFSIVSSLIIIGIIHIYVFITTPVLSNTPVAINIKSGTSAWNISKELEERGVVSNASLFMLVALYSQKVRHLQAGIYVFEGELCPKGVIDILFCGKTIRYKVTIPEGSNIFDVADVLLAKGLGDRHEFIRLARSRQTAKFFDLDAPTMEGYLFPETYFLSPDMTPLEIMGIMVNQLHHVYTPNLANKARDWGLSENEVITLASIVEKEAVYPQEMPIISAVFHNRLKKGMRLQSDPTTIYGIEGFQGKISKEDLLRDSAYNTYRHFGLPPGPICNPGGSAITAILYPAKVDYLYFVSKGDGHHDFSSTLAEHNKAINRARKAKK